jgi:hypothetical protein
MAHFVWGPFGWVEADHSVTDGTLPLRYGRWRHPDPQHWHDVRREALVRDCWRCVACNAPEPLEVHHRTYQRWGREEVEDVYTLCRDCHAAFHEGRRLAA